MNEVSRFLDAIEHGDPGAAAKLLPLVATTSYASSRREHMMNEGPGHTLNATAAWSHEAYLRLVDEGSFNGRPSTSSPRLPRRCGASSSSTPEPGAG